MTLKDLPIGKTATVRAVGGEGALRHHFLDMGLIPTASVTMVKYAPMGDPVEVRIHSYELTLRLADAEKIEIENVREAGTEAADKKEHGIPMARAIDHPGLGEGGKYHTKAEEHPLPDGTVLTFALAGNQNCGKTTLFNQLTGSNQHVGNFPSVTVDRKDGTIRGHENTKVTDLPGIYSLSPYSNEELVTRQFILQEHPKGIINIVDATNIERNLYLTMQLLELDIPMVLALNMMDEVRQNGGSVRVNELEEELGIPVIPISAAKNEGIGELIDHALHVTHFQEKPGRQDFCDADYHGGAVHRCLHGIMHLIEDHAQNAGIPVRRRSIFTLRWCSRLSLGLTTVCLQTFSIKPNRISAIAAARSSPRSFSIWLTFNVIGAVLSDGLELVIGWLTERADAALTAAGINPVLHSLLIDGVCNGVGSVLSFLPIIVTLFFFLSLLEDSGYMARVAFVMDKLLRKIGLSGRSIVPMLIGFGCTVPGVMASRTLSSERDRKMTILLTPFMSCSAKISIYAFFTAVFFPHHGAIVMIALYLLGILMGILMAMLLKTTLFKGEAVPFVMELPNYRMPGARNVAQLLWEKARDFLQKAFTVIFVATGKKTASQ